MLAVTLVGVLLFVTVAVTGVVGLVAGHRRAQAAADLAALAGASGLQDGSPPCRRAATIARRNGAVLTHCRVDDWNVTLGVAVRARLPGTSVQLRARARAGPVINAPGR
jgi:secretion/DNA translocation related TadE-like protein